MTEEWINVHTHKPGAGINIADPCLGEVELPVHGEVFYSMGIHPLYINGHTAQRLDEIETAAAEGRIVAVGEAGLDRNAPVAMNVQQEWLERQVQIAVCYDLPLIIHGVRAIPEIITVCKKYPAYRKWIMHGFNNRREILLDLLKHNFYISVGRQVMNPESNVYKLLPEIPEDRLFTETDNSDFSIEEIYRQVAERRKTTVENLQRIVQANFRHLFPVAG